MRRTLDRIYLLGGLLGAAFTVAMLLVIVAQMAARWLGIAFPGSSEYAGYCMAASAFFALGYALNRGAHIRVGLMLNLLGDRRRLGELWCFAVGSVIAVYLAYYACRAVYWSYRLGDVSQGQDAIQIWIPQLGMAIGAVIFALSLVDSFVDLLRGGRGHVVAGDESARAE